MKFKRPSKSTLTKPQGGKTKEFTALFHTPMKFTIAIAMEKIKVRTFKLNEHLCSNRFSFLFSVETVELFEIKMLKEFSTSINH